MTDYDFFDKEIGKIKIAAIDAGESENQSLILALCDIQFRIIPLLREKQRKALEVMD